ncbi:DNA-directed RNA polymerase I subunit rpa1 [Neolecta irregularis DAH-3]|uniref:DNA-directed RNA polymerase subunit n=1 Tax=Neolecta irregularis (strain DAH-3) TaxID=1198029 RepID=A0A1U7LQ24_NEOID|nr:DNA-directed RNA polymerase I subunit rpa1 [Neolecta irregularis DAH-3]|eukprot:OLL24757.1 DNA-directed RNA polymerase I subunit rpa1 [Neolecta irregularis DAH-3]
MPPPKPPAAEIQSLHFSFIPPALVEKLSVVHICNPAVFDNLGHPTKGGLYDLALGPFRKHDLCATCALDQRFCPGHYGHITLPTPCYNPLVFPQMLALLKAACLSCHNFRLASLAVHLFVCKFSLLHHALLPEAALIDNIAIIPDDSQKATRLLPANIIAQRDAFVQNAIRASKPCPPKSLAVAEEKRRLVLSFLKQISARRVCENCRAISPTFRQHNHAKIFKLPLSKRHRDKMQAQGTVIPDILKPLSKDDNMDTTTDSSDSASQVIPTKYMASDQVRNHLARLFKKEQKIISLIYSSQSKSNNTVSSDMFFLHKLAVPPTRFRPSTKVGDNIHENVQNDLFGKILTCSANIRTLNEQVATGRNSTDKQAEAAAKQAFDQLVSAFIQLQYDVNSLIDSNRNPTKFPPGKLAPPGIKQVLEKKEGLFRKHMMGKRVNFTARSVISPDPNIETSEIGVPPIFASKLTYPEPVTPFNVQQMRKAVINGPKWPGASHILNEDGKLTFLERMPIEKRTALANQLLTPNNAANRQTPINKVVYRHLQNGDVVLLNRQPTLHKPSIMAHNARILKGEKTIRMHYANCNTYNADFDGDEMNMHFPQNEVARAEAQFIADTNSQYLVPTSGNPLRGLIQDHVVTGVWMTKRDTFFTREEYQQLLCGSLHPQDTNVNGPRLITIPPAIIKPRPLWTGKQIISTIILNLKPPDRPGLNLLSKSKVASRYWGINSEEDQVIFKNGHLLVGILDKSQFGASAYGLVHSVYEIYEPETAGKLLSVLGRCFTKYVQMRGFTCGMDDLRLSTTGDKARLDSIRKGENYGTRVAQDYVSCQNIELLPLRMEEILRDDEKLAGLDSAMRSKMGGLTSLVINECLPDGLFKKFPENNMQMMTVSGAKGSNVNVSQISCLLGQQELEGKRVPVMISGKTLPSFKPFDTRAIAGGYIASRFLTGVLPQEYFFHCMAGREGLIDTAVKTSRSGYLQRCLIKHLEGIRVHYDHTVRDADGSLIQFHYGEDSLDVVKSQHLYKFGFSAMNHNSLVQKYNPRGSLAGLDVDKAWPFSKKALKHPRKFDPVLSVYSPSRHLGSVSETFHKELEEYLIQNKDHLIKSKNDQPRALLNTLDQVSKKHFRALMQLKYIKSLVDPGEAVGVLAGQSIGEPSTQMTLNTFHFAGLGAKNVTLGIPRLREIIMIATANIRTPTMTLKILDSVSDTLAQHFCKKTSRLVLSDLVDTASVSEKQITATGNVLIKIFTIKLKFFPREEYELEYGIPQSEIEKTCAVLFLVKLSSAISKQVKQSNKKMGDIGVSFGRTSNSGGDELDEYGQGHDESDDDDGDAMSSKRAANASEKATYDAPDEDERRIIEDQNPVDEEDYEIDDIGKDDELCQFRERKTREKEIVINEVGEKVAREQDILDQFTNVKSWKFDKNGEWIEIELQYPHDLPKLLMINIIEKVCRETVVHEMKGVGRCFRLPGESKLDTSRLLATEGVNFKEMWQHADIIDLSSIYSNDIAAVMTTYGVEAARQVIIKEVSGVFKVYGIAVDLRHLTLIADYMTFEGGYRAFNRMGIESSVSPLLKMSFETTCHFLTNATLYGDYDSLDNPSASLVLGKVVKVGTGSFDVLTPLNKEQALV